MIIGILLIISLIYSPILADETLHLDIQGADNDEPEEVFEGTELNTALNKSWISGVTSQSNLTPEQKKKIAGLINKPVNKDVMTATPPITVPDYLPESFDWRDNGGDFTTPVKDQGEECGSCWAHAVIGVLEAHYKIVNNDPSLELDLSEQYLVSCDGDDDGCDGGDFDTAMPYIVDTPGPDGKVGVVLEEDYPYSETDESCMDFSGLTRYKADKWAYVNAETEEDPEGGIPSVDELKAAIYLKGPIAVGVESDDDFDDYAGGVFYSENEYSETNHAVILVGWGTMDDEEYFIGKNSVGRNWGEGGWFRIDVNSNRIGEGAVYLDTV
jgi:C1A family cysteine protease